MKIIPLSEGTFTIDKTKRFVPFDDTEHQLHERPAGSLLVEIQPFVVITSRDILLLDAGLGFEKNGVLQLHQNLMDNGINPGDGARPPPPRLRAGSRGDRTSEREEVPDHAPAFLGEPVPASDVELVDVLMTA